MQISKIRKKILKEIKPYIAENGWDKDIIIDFAKSSNFKYHEIISFFMDSDNNSFFSESEIIDKFSKVNDEEKKSSAPVMYSLLTVNQ